MTQSLSPLLSKWPSVPAYQRLTCHKIRKSGSLGRKNFFPGQGKNIVWLLSRYNRSKCYD